MMGYALRANPFYNGLDPRFLGDDKHQVLLSFPKLI